MHTGWIEKRTYMCWFKLESASLFLWLLLWCSCSDRSSPTTSLWPHSGHISDKQHGAGCQPWLSAALNPCWAETMWQSHCSDCPYVTLTTNNTGVLYMKLIPHKVPHSVDVLGQRQTNGRMPTQPQCISWMWLIQDIYFRSDELILLNRVIKI